MTDVHEARPARPDTAQPSGVVVHTMTGGLVAGMLVGTFVPIPFPLPLIGWAMGGFFGAVAGLVSGVVLTACARWLRTPATAGSVGVVLGGVFGTPAVAYLFETGPIGTAVAAMLCAAIGFFGAQLALDV